jgi:UDP-4-amino-4,6-dideoxy-N-acetyl-beta-L-altrosamine N-acetyltransferase
MKKDVRNLPLGRVAPIHHGKDIRIGKLLLRNFVNLSEDELKLVLTWRNHEAVRKLVASNPRVICFSEHEKFVQRLTKDDNRYYFLVGSGKHSLGVICLLNIDFYNRRCTWGDYADPGSVHRGIGLILEYAALYLAFDVLGLHRVRCETLGENHGALRLHEFFGLEEEGRLRDYLYRGSENSYHDVVIMSIPEEKWMARKPSLHEMLSVFLGE